MWKHPRSLYFNGYFSNNGNIYIPGMPLKLHPYFPDASTAYLVE